MTTDLDKLADLAATTADLAGDTMKAVVLATAIRTRSLAKWSLHWHELATVAAQIRRRVETGHVDPRDLEALAHFERLRDNHDRDILAVHGFIERLRKVKCDDEGKATIAQSIMEAEAKLDALHAMEGAVNEEVTIDI